MSDLKNVLIIGAGSIGHRHLRCFQATGRVRLSLCEVNPALRQQIAAQYDVRDTFADLDSALSRRHDAAVIATPANLHIGMATRLAGQGVHLLIEKPLSTGLEGLDTLRATIEQHRVAAAVAYVLRNHPVMQGMKQALDSGRFGRPVQWTSVSGQHFPTFRPAYREIYYRNHATGGGAIQDALTHVVNLAEWFLGPADRVLADAEHQVLEGVDVEDTVHLLARHGRAMACYSLNQHQAANEMTATIVCEGGTLRLEMHRWRWRWVVRPNDPWNDELCPEMERDALFTAQANAFLDCVEGRAGPVCSVAEGVQTLRVNLAALESVRTQTWQTIQR